MNDRLTMPSPEDRQLRRRLILEEWTELCIAAHEKQGAELIADGLCDLLYVLYGTAVTYGVYPIIPPYGNVQYNKAVIETQVLETFEVLITERIGNLFKCMHQNTMVESALTSVITAVITMSKLYGFPLPELFTEVHTSNMTKAPLNEHQKGGKVGKGADFKPPRIKEILEDHLVSLG